MQEFFKKNRKKIIKLIKSLSLALVIVISLFSFEVAMGAEGEEQIRITTYYPSPFGIYQKLGLTPTTTCPAGDCINCDDPGRMYYNQTSHQIFYCNGATSPDTWAPLSTGSKWMLDNTQPYLYTRDSDTSVICPNYKVGIGTATPKFKLTVENEEYETSTGTWNPDGAIIAKGTFGSGADVTTDTADSDFARFIWWPKKSAFLAGYAMSGLYDFGPTFIGDHSIGLGFYPHVRAPYSIAIAGGWVFSEAAENAIAIGYYAKAKGDSSFAIGGDNITAEASGAIALGGFQISAFNAYAIIMGRGNPRLSNNSAYSLMVAFDVSGLYPATPLLFIRGDDYAAPNSNVMAIRTANTPDNYAFYVNGKAWGTTAWDGPASDARLKENIQPIDNALDKVLKLRGVNFQWRDPKAYSSGVKMGLVAQEAEEIIPEVITKSDKYYSMQYEPIVALLIEAIKEQDKEITQLETELNIDHPEGDF